MRPWTLLVTLGREWCYNSALERHDEATNGFEFDEESIRTIEMYVNFGYC